MVFFQGAEKQYDDTLIEIFIRKKEEKTIKKKYLVSTNDTIASLK